MWEYKPDETPKKKHAWGNPYAGFVRVGGVEIGKCPKDFDLREAERLINEGIPFSSRRSHRKHPDRIYVVHDGVLYRAVPTIEGVSYHGFPELPKDFNDLPTRIQNQIWDRAESMGQIKQVKRWLRG